MRYREHSKLENEFQSLILDFWIERDVRPEWIMRILIETAASYTPKIDEYYEFRTDYDKAAAWDELKSRLEGAPDIDNKEIILEAMAEIYKEDEEDKG